ncbi:MAG: arylsulfatase, partial [Bacteroidota bacterium]
SHLAGVPLPDDRTIDGVDLTPALLGEGESPRNELLFYRGATLYAARKENFKAHYIIEGAYGQFEERQELETPMLFDLSTDPSETNNVAEKNMAVLADIERMVQEHRDNLVEVKDQLAERE